MKKLIVIEGGIGKNIAITASIRSLKKQFPNDEISVLTAYPFVFYNNPHINKIYEFGKLEYFYDDVMSKQDVIYAQNVYTDTNYILGKTNLIETYCNIFGVKYDGLGPELFFNYAEIDAVKQALQPIMNKPILAVQTNGGVGGDWKWDRDMPKDLINPLLSRYIKSHNILHFRSPEQPTLDGDNIFHTADMTVRNAMIAIMFTEKRLLIDSWVMHAAAALNLKSTVFWIASNPNKLGYGIHNNIKANLPNNKHSRINSVFSDYDIQASPQSCPFKNSNIFNYNEIMNKI